MGLPAVTEATPQGVREEWAPGETAWFEYACLESHESSDAELWYHSHQQVVVLGRAEADGWDDYYAGSTFRERMEDGAPRAYTVRFVDGLEYTAMEDELVESVVFFHRPDPPSRPA